MIRPPRQRAAFSKVLAKGQTLIQREVRKKLKLKPGDTLGYRATDDGILLDKATEAGDDPFAAFSEWTSEADEKAYGGLMLPPGGVRRPPTRPTPRRRR
jgi:antitoxin PrlF